MNHLKIQIYKDKSEGWRWRLLAANNKIVADSAEAYSSKAHVERAIHSVFMIPVTYKL